MASFLMVVDPDASRRAAFCAAGARRVAPFPDLVAGGCSCGDFEAVWAAGKRAPVHHESDAKGAAVIWGDVLDERGARVAPGSLRARWAGTDTALPAFDGYHAAAVYDTARGAGLTLGADLTGMFPVYWWGAHDVVLAGSSPELFRLHPCFRSSLDAEGLAAMLLVMYSVDGRTPLAGVRRLAPGHVLRACAGRAPREVEHYRLPLSGAYHEIPFSGQVELLHEALGDATRRQLPAGEPCALALSGGRDSRLVAGLLERERRQVTAATFGEADDVEMRCARAVARTTGFDHRTLPLEVDSEGKCGDLHATWFHCTTGFGSLAHWGSAARMQDLPARMATGYVMDSILGATHILSAYDRASRRLSFDTFFARINAHGVDHDILRRLFAGRGRGDLVDAARATIQRTYEAYSDLESQRAWCFDIHHRQRFHVGNPPWFFSFATWPVQPALDRRVLEVAGGLPFATLSERRAQDEILRRYFPHLAELPLDRNSYDTEPLSPRVRYLVRRYIGDRLAPLTVPLSRLRRDAGEHRFYYRVFDFNGPGWQAIRRLAEPQREKLGELLDRDRLDEYLPPPGVELRMKNGIVESSGRKMLVGLMLWARDHM